MINQSVQFTCQGPSSWLRLLLLKKTKKKLSYRGKKMFKHGDNPEDYDEKLMNCWGFVLFCMLQSKFLKPNRATKLYNRFNNDFGNSGVFMNRDSSSTFAPGVPPGNYFFGTWSELLAINWTPAEAHNKVIILSTESSCSTVLNGNVLVEVSVANANTFYSHVGMLRMEDGGWRDQISGL
ncbi:hypothetical protein AKO1_004392 [Acrasis kona]|uniref:Uncharacterized protein n=1 Tax=Acrasis kona TaxID=1008807 RepID=A0AAW2YNJ2_9EUKA